MILCTGFKGNKNSSKILLDYLRQNNNIHCLYLDNDFEISESQLKNNLKENRYDTIFAFGQKPVIKSLYIEKAAAHECERLETKYNYVDLKNFLKNYFKVKISENAGNYLCNNIYYKGLKYIDDNKIKMIFIHIPCRNKIDTEYLSQIMTNYFCNILNYK